MTDAPKAVALDLEAGRRAFLKASGLMAAGLTAGAALVGSTAPAAAGPSDAEILNFALNLEYLEAEFYLRAVTGMGLDFSDTTGEGKQGAVVGGRQVNFQDKNVRDYAAEIAGDEKAHVKFLRAALGSHAVARPQINLRASFTAAARGAGLIGANQQFDAFANDTTFLLAAFIFEDVGVTAYKGAAPLLDNKDYVSAAAGILAVEAYHAGEIRTLLYGRGLFKEAKAISDLRDKVDSPNYRDQPIRLDGQANIVPADENGIAFGRTPKQVLNIVYLGGDANNYGFFPDKLNGSIA